MCLVWSYAFIPEFNSCDSAQTSLKGWESGKKKNIKKSAKETYTINPSSLCFLKHLFNLSGSLFHMSKLKHFKAN